MEYNLILEISKSVKRLMINDPFYGMFIGGIEKQETKEIPTLAVCLNKATMDFKLLIKQIESSSLSS